VRGLEVRALVAAPGDADPVERGQDALGPLGPVTCRVGVLDAQHEHPALLLGEDPVLQRRTGAADVEHTGRGRGEAYTYRHAPQPTAGREGFPAGGRVRAPT